MKPLERVATTPERLREAMSDAGKNQMDLAKETGMAHSSVSRYLSGIMEPKQKAVGLMARALNVSEMWLWGYDCPKERPLEQKNNDILSDIVVKLRTDKDFFSVVHSIYLLDAEKIKKLDAFLK